MYDFQFAHAERILSDDSIAHDVVMSIDDGQHWHTLPALSRGDAWELVNKLADAINEHTNLEARTA